MHIRHLEELAPICPRCRADGQGDVTLVLAVTERQRGDDVLEGLLHCPRNGCRLEYPIIDGIPIIVPDVARYLADNLWYINLRGDLSETLESLLGDAAGPGSAFDTMRYHLGSYAHDHWGEFDPLETAAADGPSAPGAVARCLTAGLDLLGNDLPAGPALDIGCSVGRSSSVLADRTHGLVLGVDLNFVMLRLARRAITEGRVIYPRRRIGVVYDRRSFGVPVVAPERVDFWACDAMALPFPGHRFALTTALNILDCVPAPSSLLTGIRDNLLPGGGAVLATPYDWSGSVTQPQAWIGGHSQRGSSQGAAESRLRSLLTEEIGAPTLRIAGENTNFPWHVRLHDRSTVAYSTHLVAVRAVGAVG